MNYAIRLINVGAGPETNAYPIADLGSQLLLVMQSDNHLGS